MGHATALACVVGSAYAAPDLPALGTDRAALTVSGLSSGAYMAVQLQVAHADRIRGVGILAGGPYFCAEGSVTRALANCMSPSQKSPPPAPERQRQVLNDIAARGSIASPEHLRNQRVWLFSGAQDHTVERPVMDALAGFYQGLLPGAAVRYVKHPDAGHAMISVAAAKPNACASSDPPYINQCLQFDAAGDLLAHLLGPLAARSLSPTGSVLRFDQRPFVTGKAIDAGLADDGYLYVPAACRHGGCRTHVALHGCRQNAASIGTRFVDGAGYNAWADNNRLIVLYPQTAARYGPAFGSWKFIYNPKACWDWWGYSGVEYHTRNAPQIRAIMAMIEQLAQVLPATGNR